jgi:hypothetical protein
MILGDVVVVEVEAAVVATQHPQTLGVNLVIGQQLNPWMEMPQLTSQRRTKFLSLFYSSR